ncbi:MAG: S-adenosylmethionine decarboxylase [Thermoproteota archaeon]|nr:S-adenosylmethionine decarboxylase [Thermoproteota archaeon]
MGKLIEHQIIAKFYGCKADLMDSESLLNTVIQAINISGMHLCGSPQVTTIDDDEYGGVSILALITESHVALHTWPKFGHTWVDIATCGSGIPEKGLDVIRQFLMANNEKIEYNSIDNVSLSSK